jgi:hypothetical protein
MYAPNIFNTLAVNPPKTYFYLFCDIVSLMLMIASVTFFISVIESFSTEKAWFFELLEKKGYVSFDSDDL